MSFLRNLLGRKQATGAQAGDESSESAEKPAPTQETPPAARVSVPGRLALALVFGFDRMPSREELMQVVASDPVLSDLTVSDGVSVRPGTTPGPAPKADAGLPALAFTLARFHGRNLLHREIDPGKVTFGLVHGFLVLRIWE